MIKSICQQIEIVTKDPRPVLDFSRKTTRGIVFGFFVKSKNELVWPINAFQRVLGKFCEFVQYTYATCVTLVRAYVFKGFFRKSLFRTSLSVVLSVVLLITTRAKLARNQFVPSFSKNVGTNQFLASFVVKNTSQKLVRPQMTCK